MAAWSATDDFESYSVAALNGDNAGSGWSAAYVASNCDVVSSPTLLGTRAVWLKSATGASGDATRTITTGVTSGIFRGYIYATNLPTGTKGFIPFIFYEGASLRFRTDWGSGIAGLTGNTISFGNNTTAETLSTSASAATLYYLEVEFDQANNRARANFNGGAWSAYVTAEGGSFTSIDKLRFTTADGNASDQGYYVDDIGVGTGPATTSTHFLSLLGVGT